LRLAEVLLEQGQLDESETLFRDVLRQDPSEPRAHLGMGRIMRSRGDFRASIGHLRTSLTRAPRVRQSYALLTEAYHRVGDTGSAERARRDMQRLPDVVLWPDPYLEQVMAREVGVVAVISRVDSFLQGREYDHALKLLRQASAVHPESAEVHFQLWRVLYARNQFAEANRELQAATRLAAEGVQAHYYRGIAHSLRGDHSSAVGAYRRTLELNPQFGAAYCDLGESLDALGDRRGAIDAYRASVRYRPNLARARVQLAKALAAEGRYPEALEQLGLADSLQPLNSSSRSLLEDLRRRAGDTGRR
jgi:tetratricopeptide (TPR) repeat protein